VDVLIPEAAVNNKMAKKQNNDLNRKHFSMLEVIAIVISVVSLYYSCEAVRLSKQAHQLTLQPSLLINFETSQLLDESEIALLNDGVLALEDISVRVHFRIWQANKSEIVHILNESKDWQSIKKLKPQDPMTFNAGPHIKSLASRFLENFDLVGKNIVGVIQVKFRRSVDRKRFYEYRYFTLQKDKNGNTRLIDLDHLPLFGEPLIMREAIRRYDKKFLPNIK
jgi:hypothetical protein